jgi:hypothetical protein
VLTDKLSVLGTRIGNAHITWQLQAMLFGQACTHRCEGLKLVPICYFCGLSFWGSFGLVVWWLGGDAPHSGWHLGAELLRRPDQLQFRGTEHRVLGVVRRWWVVWVGGQ